MAFEDWQKPPDSEDAAHATPLGVTKQKRGRLASMKSAVVDFFVEKPVEIDAKYKHGKHSIKDNTPVVTERNWYGKLQQVFNREGLREERYDRVLITAVDWWFNHSTDLINFWPVDKYPHGPGEHHPFYDQWQMARTFVHKGRVNKALIMKAFEEDHEFYEKTMFFKRYNAIMIKNVLGIEKIIRERHGIFKGPQKPLGDEILVPEDARGGGIRMEKVVPSILEAEASVLAALATISAALTVAGNAIALPPAFLTTIGALGAVAGTALSTATGVAAVGTIGMVGGVGAYLVGKDAIHRIIQAAKERNEFDNLSNVCQQALAVVKQDTGTCAFMSKKFGININDVSVVNGKLHFTEGSSSTGWISAQETLIQEEWFRQKYLHDLVLLDDRSLNPFNSRLKRVHLYEDQFLTEKNGRLIISQSGSTYERDWATRFEEMRCARNTNGNLDMVPANREALQQLYMEAGKSICIEIANERFKKEVLPAILKEDSKDVPMTDYTKEVGRKIAALKRGENKDEEKDGEDRKIIKKQAKAALDRATELKDGMQAKDGEPAKAGLAQAKELIRGTKPDEPGLYDRKASLEKQYQDVYDAALKIPQFYPRVVEVRERKSITSIVTLMGEVQLAIDGITQRSRTGILSQLEAQMKGLNTAHTLRMGVISNDPSYTGSGAEAKRSADLKKQQEIFDQEASRITKQIEDAEGKLAKLEALLVKLQEKQQELTKQYQTLEYARVEREHIAGLAEHMKASYTKIRRAIPHARLISYGTPGNMMGDFMADIVAAGRIWTQPQSEEYENQLTVLYAVAEARARVQNKELHKQPTGIHADLLDKTKGKLSPEQLISMSSHEVYDRVHSSMQGWTAPPTYDQSHLQEISQATSIETARYEAREKALQSVMETQGLVIERMTKELKTVDEACDARIEQLVLLKAVIQDRGVVYCEAPSMVQIENLRTYADGSVIQATDTSHSTMEVSHPIGFVKFLQDAFAYHVFDTEKGRGEKAGNREDMDLLVKNSRDALFDNLLRSLGVPPELKLANMIVKGYGQEEFQQLLVPPVLAKQLTFSDVMSVIAYRHDHTFPLPTVGGVQIAQTRNADYPIKPGEMKKILEKIVVTLTEEAMAGHI